jgi:hypothetical protein
MKTCATSCAPISGLIIKVLPLCVALITINACGSLCSNQELEEALSPDKKHHAIVFNRDCGATTALNVQVSLLPAAQRLENTGNVFIVDAGKSTSASQSLNVHIMWINSKELTVSYTPRSARVFLQRRKVEDVLVKYESH